MLEALAPLIFIIAIYRLMTANPKRKPFGAVDAMTSDTPGLLLSALASAQIGALLEVPSLGAMLLLLTVSAVGLVLFHELTAAALGVFGSVTTLVALTDGACTANHPLLLRTFLIVALLLGMLAIASVHLAGSMLSAERGIGSWFLGLFASLETIATALSPGGFSLLETGTSAAPIVALSFLLALIVVGIALIPAFATSVLGVGLVTANLLLDTVGASCQASHGWLLITVAALTIGVSTTRRFFC